MSIEYTTNPKTFSELCDSVRGQVERTRELKMKGQEIPYEESVVMTSEAFLATLDRIEQLSDAITQNTELFLQINDIFQWIFKFIGLDMDALIFDSESDDGDGMDYEG